MTILLAALVAAFAVWFLLPEAPTLARSRRRAPGLPRLAPLIAVAVMAAVAAGVVGGPSGLLWALDACVLGATTAWLASATLAERRRAARADEIAHAMQVVAGQLRVGSVPSVALTGAARDCPCLERPTATQAIGGDVAVALADAGAAPGREGLQSLSRAWELGERTGAPMAELATHVSDQVRRDRETRRVVAAELAGPRATGRLLACLPAVGLLMGRFAGAHPVAFLVHTLPGQACLFGGIALSCSGLAWTEHMARRAQEV